MYCACASALTAEELNQMIAKIETKNLSIARTSSIQIPQNYKVARLIQKKSK